MLLNLDVQFKPTLSVAEIGAAVERLEKTIREHHPEVRRIFVEARSFTRQPSYPHGLDAVRSVGGLRLSG